MWDNKLLVLGFEKDYKKYKLQLFQKDSDESKFEKETKESEFDFKMQSNYTINALM